MLISSKELFLLSDARKGKKKKRESPKDKLNHDNMVLANNNKNKRVESHYAFNKPMVPSVSISFCYCNWPVELEGI